MLKKKKKIIFKTQKLLYPKAGLNEIQYYVTT